MKSKLIKILAFYLVLLSTFDLFAGSEQDPRILKIESLDQIATHQPTKTIYFFDIDDTLIDFPYMFGSKAWRKYIDEATKNQPAKNWHDVLTFFIAQNYPLQTVETVTSQFVKELQTKGYGVFGLTARERNKWYDMPMDGIDLLTTRQLESVGIHFESSDEYLYLTRFPEYYEGTFFADLEPKGEYILKLFKDAPQLPEKVIFIDDKKSQAESVASALNALGIDYECYWYCATDPKASHFDPLIANIQFYYFWTSGGVDVLSDEEAALIAQQYPERDATSYLHFLLNDLSNQ